MHRRLVIGTLVLGLAATAAPATHAGAVRKACKLITDDEGDGHADGVPGFESDTIDVLSADVSSGRTQVTGIMRLKSLHVDGDPVAATGERFALIFTVGGTKYTFWARYDGVMGTSANKWGGGLSVGVGGDQSKPTAQFRLDGSSIVWTVDRSALEPLKRGRQDFVLNAANTSVFSFGADGATAKPNTKYRDRAPSCLPSK